MEVFPGITVESEKCGGKPCIRGYRLTVEHLLAILSEGRTLSQLKADWEFLEQADITAALLFASHLAGQPQSLNAESDLAGLAAAAKRRIIME